MLQKLERETERPKEIAMIRNTVFNLLGQGLPLVVAIFSIPALIHLLGAEKFGVLTIIWAIVGYLGLFDLGLGRSLTLLIARADANNDKRNIGALSTTALFLLGFLGIAMGTLLGTATLLSAYFFRPLFLTDEIVATFLALAFALPAITLTSGFRGILEARQRFGILNVIRVPTGVFTFLGPLVVVLWTPQLDVIAWALVAGRWVGLAAHAYFASSAIRGCGPYYFDKRSFSPLLAIGGWLTVGNITSPLMGYADRFVIAGMLSATFVAYYATPYELVTKLWIVPSALTAVLFPAFAAHSHATKLVSGDLYIRCLNSLVALMLPVCSFLGIFSAEILQVWIGTEFSSNGWLIMSIFSFGILVNSATHIPVTIIQSTGNAKVMAIIQVAEVAPFILILWVLTSRFGIEGAALAWLTRIFFDSIVIFVVSSRFIDNDLVSKRKMAILCGLIFMLAIATSVALIPGTTQIRAAVFLAISLACAMILACEARSHVRTKKRQS